MVPKLAKLPKSGAAFRGKHCVTAKLSRLWGKSCSPAAFWFCPGVFLFFAVSMGPSTTTSLTHTNSHVLACSMSHPVHSSTHSCRLTTPVLSEYMIYRGCPSSTDRSRTKSRIHKEGFPTSSTGRQI